MNPDTRIGVHCYAGDHEQVQEKLALYAHHGCPVTILSPVDAPVTIEGLDCRQGGYRSRKLSARTMHTLADGQKSLDRQREHLRILLGYPEQFFLLNDADSVCLSPEIPDYLYREPDVLWSNLVYDPIPHQQHGYPAGFPRLAFQPPYFLSRTTIERLLAVAEGITANPVMPYIDHYMVQLAVKARVVWKGFPDGISSAISTTPGVMEHTQVAVRHKGVVFVHSVKSPRFWAPLVKAHVEWRADYRGVGDERLATETNTTADVAAVGQELARSPGRDFRDPEDRAGYRRPEMVAHATERQRQRLALETQRRARGLKA